MLLFASGALVAGGDSTAGRELQVFLARMEKNNPQLEAARMRAAQALERHAELQEFFDPILTAGGGYGENVRGVPYASSGAVADNDIGVKAGVEAALNPGAYVSAGTDVSRLFEVPGEHRLFQNLFGIRARIPLLRDRGFALLALRQKIAMAEYNMSVSELLDLSQRLRNRLENLYISCYERLSASQVSREAVKRFEQLAREAGELAALKTIPDYEVRDTVRELQISREDLRIAENRFALSLIELQELLGGDQEIRLSGKADLFITEARKELQHHRKITLAQGLENRGISIYHLNRLNRNEASREKALEEMRDEVSLEAGVYLQGESQNHPFGLSRRLSDNYFGGDVGVVWRRPLGYAGEKSRLARLDFQHREIKADMASVRFQIRRELQQEQLNYSAAQDRMHLLLKGVQAARDTVKAEQERFRLGEGSSNTVLDAQKNLTIILQRLTSAAADLLRARSNYRYAGGYGEEKFNK